MSKKKLLKLGASWNISNFVYQNQKFKITVSQRIFILEAKFEMFQDALEISYHLSYLSH